MINGKVQMFQFQYHVINFSTKLCLFQSCQVNFILSGDVNETGTLDFAGIRKRFIFATDTFEADFSTLLHISNI